MRATTLPYMIALLLLIAACKTKTSETTDMATDSVTIAKGRTAFIQNCSSCHNFRQDGIGPQLSGITTAVSQQWIKNFIRNPKALIESGDERSTNLFARYKTMMPAFGHYSGEELDAIVAYLHTEQAVVPPVTDRGLKKPDNPIAEPIQPSDLVVGVKLVTQVPASSTKGIKTRIAKLDYIPGTERTFIVDIRGKLYELRDNKPQVYMNMTSLKPDFIDAPGLATGFGSFAFHPEFLKNGLLYTSHTEPPGSAKADFHYVDSIPVTVQWVITEWQAEQPGSFPFSGKGRELFRIDMVTGMHGVQEITFNPTAGPNDKDYGLLHIGIGDGASVQSGYPFLVQSIEKPWGSIFRIDPSGNNSANGKYGIPGSNPFVSGDNSQALGEIYAYGFRNPHRITWTSAGQMLASNIGQAHIESVNLVLPGHNYGWPIREGTFLVNPYGDINVVYPLPENDATYAITYPAAQYDHDEGLAISGGFEYTAPELSELHGKYLFADMNNGRLYYINLAEVMPGKQAIIREWKITLNGKPTTTAELCGSKRVDLRLGKDHKGNVYFFSKQDGKVYRLIPAQTTLSLR
jgi:glucose/arabinose dehydrogenase/mono/diheme cytochrome c family protein